MEFKTFKLEVGGKELKVEIRNLAEQANGNVLVQYGDTMVLATAVMTEQQRQGINFFPLTVEYEEKFYAAGKILGSRFIRRESRPSDEAILTARFIDRAIRPRFPKGLKKEIQVVVTCLSWDKENDPDIIGLIAASLALTISDIPWSGPIACLRVGKTRPDPSITQAPAKGEEEDFSSSPAQKTKFILNPTYSQREESNLDFTVAAMNKADKALINMIELEGEEIQEDEILKATEFAKPELKRLIDFQEEIREKIGKEKIKIEEPIPDKELEKEIKDFLKDKLEPALFQTDKTEKKQNLHELKEELICFIEGKYSDKLMNSSDARDEAKASSLHFVRLCLTRVFEKEIEELLHKNIIKKEKRPDTRKLDEIREIQTEVGLLPRTHGSGLFSRGQTKALSILTLGSPNDVRLLEGMEIIGKKRFMHHYNFPPYSTGEIKPMRGPGRRDIGHGMLAEKALFPLIPNSKEFPYTIRIVTEILSSNGSSSMAAVSSSSLALMDAGVPIKAPVTGIALGLMQDNNGNYKILTDIQGPEDHYGDMDFKIAGTEKGITACQMDVKIEGITQEILIKVLEQGKKARLKILSEMKTVLEKPRTELSSFAPRILSLQINPEKIREVIGPGGKIINGLIEEYKVAIDIEDSGLVFVTAQDPEAAQKAIARINDIVREVEEGEVFQGKVKKIMDFGAFVEVLPGQDGLVHISQLAPYRVNKVEDIVKVGDIIPVKVIAIDERGKISLSAKETGSKNKK